MEKASFPAYVGGGDNDYDFSDTEDLAMDEAIDKALNQKN
jgi:hypothetical protein